MDSKEFLQFGNAMLEYISNYLENIRERRVFPSIQPGYIRDLIPDEAPKEGETWQDVMNDIERVIMPGVTHWQSPNFHAYYPSGNSYPSIVAEMLSGAISCLGFSWAACPACTELEVVTLDWLGKAIGLPDAFLSGPSKGKGGGVIQGTASEATLLSLFAARERIIKNANSEEKALKEKLVAYGSDQAHSSVTKAGLLSGVIMKLVPTDADFGMHGRKLMDMIEEDRTAGLVPFFVVATLGTTSSCAFDKLDEIGDICKAEGLWLHVDAAYAGAAFICEEYRQLMAGIENVDSFCINPHKWMLINFDLSAIWLKNASEVVDPFKVEPVYLISDQKAPDLTHWQIPFGRRFRSIKLWFVMRIYGIQGLQDFIRKQIQQAIEFEKMVREDDRFEVATPATMGIVCFRLKGSNEFNKVLLRTINQRGKVHLVPTMLRKTYVLRFVICSRYTASEDVIISWNEIRDSAAEANLIRDKSVALKM